MHRHRHILQTRQPKSSPKSCSQYEAVSGLPCFSHSVYRWIFFSFVMTIPFSQVVMSHINNRINMAAFHFLTVCETNGRFTTRFDSRIRILIKSSSSQLASISKDTSSTTIPARSGNETFVFSPCGPPWHGSLFEDGDSLPLYSRCLPTLPTQFLSQVPRDTTHLPSFRGSGPRGILGSRPQL